ncbi:MAG: hypothetical protein KatS3mg002_1600 [Candidatus Woesearchaeota archaeon]|nr:MAG: hypothetical protein KatS3mg002_1600 [Candidatus Woesearchaeota archaeon]
MANEKFFNMLPEEPDDLDKLLNDEEDHQDTNESSKQDSLNNVNNEDKSEELVEVEQNDDILNDEQFEDDPLASVVIGVDDSDIINTKKVLNKTLEDSDDEETFKSKIKQLVKEGIISVYEDKEDIDEYTHEELVRLIKDNIQEVNKKAQEQAILNLLDTLPEEVQYVIEYALKDGKDFKKVFKLLAEYDETKDITNILEDEDIITLYYKDVKGMSDEEIEALIDSYKNKGIFNSKVAQAKRELQELRKGKIQEEINKQEQEIENRRKTFEEFKNSLINNVEKSEIFKRAKGGKLKDEFISSLLELKYDSISGLKTNKFNHLLEKYLYVEPNYDIIGEVYWLLSDPESYKEYVKSDVKQKVIKEEVVPKLKRKSQEIAQQSNENIDYNTEDIKKIKKHEINRNKRRFFDF